MQGPRCHSYLPLLLKDLTTSNHLATVQAAGTDALGLESNLGPSHRVQVLMSKSRRLGMTSRVFLVPGIDTGRSSLLGSHGNDGEIDFLDNESISS